MISEEDKVQGESDENQEQELFEHFRIVADPGQKPFRVDKFLSEKIMNASRNKIQMAAEAGNIHVNDSPVKSNYKIKPGDVITLVMEYPKREGLIIPEDIPVDVVYEDDQLLVLNKAVGMVVHPGHGNYTGTLVNALAFRYADLPMFNGTDSRPGLVHRIDKNTSGLMVVAKTEIAKNKLAKQFYDKTTKRIYHAVVWGQFKDDAQEGTIDAHVGRSLKNRLQMDVFPEGDYGKSAITHYEVIKPLGYVTLIKCQLETGRTHQIRAHMKFIGHPLFNDERYGGDAVLKGTTFTKYKQYVKNCFAICPRHALHAKTLGFVHPTTGEEMNFNSELPQDMTQLIDKWSNYIVGREDK
ncbi:MAG: RluA family pseudouridine synthase [Bacteroidales bacterium]|jgi:23S rRNA pseudouridine1911/1915/1917 synthase|nr:RluA family pseudouridine synthase [Bacteroidales bacterium]